MRLWKAHCVVIQREKRAWGALVGSCEAMDAEKTGREACCKCLERKLGAQFAKFAERRQQMARSCQGVHFHREELLNFKGYTC